MSEPLSTDSMWRAMSRVLDRVYGAAAGDALVDDCLDIVIDLLAADRGLLLRTAEDSSTHVVHARAKGRALQPEEWDEASRTVIRQALDSRRCVVWDSLAAQSGSASAALLGIHLALAAPLCPRGQAPRGALYVDFRDPRRVVGSAHAEFFAAVAVLLGAVLVPYDRSVALREQLDEARQHRVDLRPTPPLEDLLAPASLQPLLREVRTALAGSSPILVLGESGTGKTLLAHAIADAIDRHPIVRAVLGSSDDLNTITSELFGHERGAYSGATGKRVGLVEYANGGTLLLDEILNLPRHAQQLLLDFTQFGTYRPLGFDRMESKRADVRIVASTNGNLLAAVREGRFREDLYHRLTGVTLEIPPLRDRRADIPGLAESTVRRLDRTRPWTLSLPLRRMLLSPALEWPGNVRQLERAVERAMQRAASRDPGATELLPEHFEPRDLGALSTEPAGLPAADEPLGTVWQRLQADRGRIDEREQEVIRQALQQSGGVVAHASRALGIARTTLNSRIDALGMRPPRRERQEPG